MDLAAMNGHLETLKWLHQNGKTCTTQAMDSAAKNGHLEVVKFLESI
jgi:ankyrin repeat protein